MKKAIILHGTDGNPQENWFQYLKEGLEQKGYSVWVPQLPQANKPNIERYTKYIGENKPFEIDEETIFIGHSSGAVAILGLLQNLPDTSKVKACYLVGAFKNDLNWDALSELFEKPFDFEKIKRMSHEFVFIHSDNDPYCPLEHAEYLSYQLDAELIILEGQKHFSVGTAGEEYRRFPFLMEVITGSES